MDEPDAPLSFTACLALAALLHDLAQAGSQAIVATHSPIVAAVPDARILELGDWGIRTARWEELHLVSACVLAGVIYARRPRSSPPLVVRAITTDDLRREIEGAERERGLR